MDLFISLLPALVMITLVIATRKVLLALFIGVILAALIHEGFHLIDSVIYIFNAFTGIILDFQWYMPIIGFVILIGGITAVISLTGGIKAFADWAVQKINNPVAAKLLTWVLGIIIFIDDYFNALVIGEVSKPVTDQYKVSRAKLAYIIDSTSAPVVILMPISTWGAYIIGLIGNSFDSAGYDRQTAFMGFVSSIPFQFYPMVAIIMVFLIIKYGINLGPMRTYEEESLKGNDTSKVADSIAVKESDIEGVSATHWTLIIPMIVLVFMTFFGLLYKANFNFSIMLEQDITLPLFFAGVSAYLTAVVFGLFDKGVKFQSMMKVSLEGFYGMIKSATLILILAWMVSGSIQDLEVGQQVGTLIEGTALAASFLPLILFLIATFIAFSTGTSWGAFAILIPIAVPIAVASNPLFMPAILASVLGGAVVGDHSSPVSDTTVLSATGAQSSLDAHFISQLPYVLVSASIASIGYLLYGLTSILFLSYIVMIIGLYIFVKLTKAKDLHDEA
ncbi:MAG: Na+/H+ antiporter NhaC family protein [Candidatus Izemoplasmataceae bacterium]